MQINLSWDSSVSTAPAGFQAAVEQAAAQQAAVRAAAAQRAAAQIAAQQQALAAARAAQQAAAARTAALPVHASVVCHWARSGGSWHQVCLTLSTNHKPGVTPAFLLSQKINGLQDSALRNSGCFVKL